MATMKSLGFVLARLMHYYLGMTSYEQSETLHESYEGLRLAIEGMAVELTTAHTHASNETVGAMVLELYVSHFDALDIPGDAHVHFSQDFPHLSLAIGDE